MIETFYLIEVFPLFLITLIITTFLLSKSGKEHVNTLVFIIGLALFTIRPFALYIYGENFPSKMLILLKYMDLGLAPSLILSSIISFIKN
ncbi:MAG: hypothetical protein DRN04_09680 [Thermoprotei archaeon]|nr:MAG: hypothetical protein DRN04_09680 [Thermoprotei archaeon]